MDKQAILDEIERRELIATLQGGATERNITPDAEVSAAEHMAGISSDRVTPKELLTATVRGLPFANELGSAAAAVPASFGSGKGIGDTYSEILASEEQKEASFAAEMPAAAALGEGLGNAYAMVPAIGLSGALAAKGASALSKVGRSVSGLRGGSAAAKAAKGPSRLGATAKAASVGALIDDDPIEGSLTGAAAVNILFNTPAGRVFTLAMSRKLGGQKFTTAAWHAMNPQNRAKLWQLFKSFKKGAK